MNRSFFSPCAFRMVGLWTIAAVYFLILVGGVVRASGSGMGCPDWPKCFGRWIPPTDVSQLPPDYQEIYKDRGYGDTTFNVVKTWTEYVNRLVGVTIGLLIFLTLVSSLGYLRTDPAVTWLSLASFLLVGFQGWLGSLVVSSNLVPYMVTVHMVVALLLVALLVYAVARSQAVSESFRASRVQPYIGALIGIALLLTVTQVILGTQVRERVDELASSLGTPNRRVWVESLGAVFYTHRSYSLVLLAVNGFLAYLLLKGGGTSSALNRCAYILLGVVTAEALAGAALYYLALPRVLQPVHLLLASVMFGVQFFALVAYRYAVRFAEETSAHSA